MREILNSFKYSRLVKHLNFEQRRNAFRYFKLESQEKMDGFSKATEQYRQIPRQSLLAPKYRLRPFTERFVETEWVKFLENPIPFRTVFISYFFLYLFWFAASRRYEKEKIIFEHLHPTEKKPIKVGDKVLVFRDMICWDDPDFDNKNLPY